MKRAAPSSSNAASKKQQLSSSTSNKKSAAATNHASQRVQNTGRGSSQAKRKGRTGSRAGGSKNTASSDDEKLLQEITDRKEVVRQVTMASSTNRYDDLAQDLLSTTVDIMGPTPDSLFFDTHTFLPHHQSSRHDHTMGDRHEQGRTQTTSLDDDGHSSVVPRKVVHSLATWAMYSIVRHFHLLAAGAASPGGLAHPVAEGHHVIHRSGNPRPTAQHHDLAVRQYKSARAIRDMPPHLSQKLFKLLRMTRPEILSTRVWTTMFFSQPWMDTIGHPAKNLDELKERQNVVHPLYVLDLEGLDPSQVLDTTLQSQYFLRTHGVIGPQLETINLNNMTQLSDKCLAKLVGKCSNLRRLFLKACENVGDLTLAALPENSLEVLNISFVKGPTAKGLQEMVYRCRELRVLKLVGVTNVRDNWLVKLKDSWEAERQDQQLSSQTEQEDQQQETAETWPLQYLQNLKISHTGIGDRGLKAILEFCGRTLQRLDISSTNVTRVGLIADYCTWEDEDEEEEAQTTQQNDTKNSDSSSSKGRSKKNRQQRRLRNRQTQLEKLNLTRVKVQSINDLIKLFDAIPPGSLHTLLLGYLSISAIPLRASDLARLAPIFWTWTKEPHSGVATIAGSSDASSANATTWLGIRHDLDPNPFRHIHSLSFFGCTQHVTRQYLGRDDGLFMVLQIFAPHLRRLELGWTNVQAYQLEAILFTKAVPGPTEDDSDNDDIVNDGMAVEPMIAQPNWVLEELGLDGCTLTKEMVDVLTSCRRLERLSLINSRLDSQEQVERLIRACPQLKSLDLTGCRGIDLALRRTMLQHVREQTLPSPTL